MDEEDGMVILPPAIEPTRHAARRRNVKSHHAILEATLDRVQEVGYNRLSIEGIAARAGVGKSTVYRWWNSKGELVLEALAEVLTPSPVPDSGDTRRDLTGIVEQAMRLYSQDTGARSIIAGLVSDMNHNADLADTLREQFIEPRRADNRAAVTRAIDRGDLPGDTDIELLIDSLVAPIAYRALITGAPLEPRIATQLVDQILGSEARAST